MNVQREAFFHGREDFLIMTDFLNGLAVKHDIHPVFHDFTYYAKKFMVGELKTWTL
jgi:hypothetical protein